VAPEHRKIERWSGLKVWLFSLLGHATSRSVASVNQLHLSETDRFLDLGCGLGEALEHASLLTASVAGVDPSPSMVARASRRVPGARIEVGSAESIPFPNSEFTAVLVLASFHHWADRSAGITEVRRVIAPGGRILVVEKQLGQGRGHGFTRSQAEDLAEELAGAGFENAAVDEMSADRTAYFTVMANTPD
jgi:ubiquinone/menaquinone biosynthesis C-methylase UbiE